MNYRKLKKQYKRKHGFNPPKGYSRAMVREGIKLSSQMNTIAVAGYRITQAFKSAGESFKKLAEALTPYREHIEHNEEVTP